MPTRTKTLASLTAATALVAAAMALPTTAQAAAGTTAVPATTPTWQTHTRSLGAAAASSPAAAHIYLQPKGGSDALKAAVTAMATKGSATYRHFLTVAQYRARYAPTNATVAKVESWVRANGMHVSSVAAGNRYVAVRGTVASANKVFGVSIQRYRHDGQDVTAPAGAVRAPAALAGSVLGVTGLDTTSVGVKRQTVTPDQPGGFRNAKPCSTYYGQLSAKYKADYTTKLPKFDGKRLPYVPCGYTGPQLRSAYEGAAAQTLNGSGVTVAITDAYASPTIRSDSDTYATNHGDGSYFKGQYTQSTLPHYLHKAACAGASGWHTEQTLDVEAVHAMAPGANIKYYASKSCFNADFLDTFDRIVNQDKVQLVTNSWAGIEVGTSESTVLAYETAFLQGAAEGISFMFSSGDDGDYLAATGYKTVSYPASDPYATGVGGTSTAIGGSGKLDFQTGWGVGFHPLSADGSSWGYAGFLGGAGGGVSTLFNQPSYQAGIAPGPARDVPDVAMDADANTGMLIGETQVFPNGTYYDEYRLGGTSLASPLFAGITALKIESAGGALGLLNPTIYADHSTEFTDVHHSNRYQGVVRVNYVNSIDNSAGLSYSVRTSDHDTSLPTLPGYDEVTGVGSANENWATSSS